MRPAAASVSVNGVSKPGLTGAVEIQCLDEGPEIGLCIPLFMNENLNRAGANKYKSAGAGSTNVRGPGPKRRFECRDRKSTRLNSSHVAISYAVFCLKKKMKIYNLEDLTLKEFNDLS